MNACKSKEENDIKEGEQLATKYCVSCHIMPSPAVADPASWQQKILPKMHEKMLSNTLFVSNEVRALYNPAPEDWAKIVRYYVASAEKDFSAKHVQHDINKDLNQFTISTIENGNEKPNVSFIKITENDRFPIITTDALTKKMHVYDLHLKELYAKSTSHTIVDMQKEEGDEWIGCDIGILNPNDYAFGQIFKVNSTFFTTNNTTNENLLLRELRRPVFVKQFDFTNDGKKDLLVGQFGNTIGELTLFETKSDNTFTKHTIHATPGAINVKLIDMNKDGLMDFVVLFAQGDESIRYYQNLGKGQFKETVWLLFPPIYGSSSFDLVDMNKDGFLDIVYTCGDNADFSTILKPYHGVYIYTNKGDNTFTETYFYAINGCYKAIPMDFDKDGDIDIATISYFADYKNKPEEGFIYFENRGKNQFDLHTDLQLQKGRWLTMDAGDFNHDSFPDIALGNFSYLKSFVDTTLDWSKGPQAIILTNKGKCK